MHDCPGARVGPGGGLHIIRHNFEIAIRKAPLARDRFPAVAFHAPIVVAAVFSGKLCSGFVSNAWALGTSSPTICSQMFDQPVDAQKSMFQPVPSTVRGTNAAACIRVRSSSTDACSSGDVDGNIFCVLQRELSQFDRHLLNRKTLKQMT